MKSLFEDLGELVVHLLAVAMAAAIVGIPAALALGYSPGRGWGLAFSGLYALLWVKSARPVGAFSRDDEP